MPETDKQPKRNLSPLSAPADQAIDHVHPHSLPPSIKPKSEPKSINAPDTNMQTMKKYTRHQGQNIILKNVHDKKLKGTLKKSEKKTHDAAYKAAQAELLLPTEVGYLEADDMERTWKFTQSQIKDNVDMSTSNKMFELKLDDFGPYTVDYTRNGRNIIMGGRKGHVATFDWRNSKLGCELQLRETVRDVKWLHNHTMFAVAQKKYTYIYDNTGMELHCLRHHIDVNRMEFLPYHFLLATVGNSGWLKYQDTSTGQLVAELRTKLGPCKAMTQNNYNAVLHLGHSNGTVTLWSPTIEEASTYMATAGLDGQLKVWDIRTYKPLEQYFTPTPASNVSISQMGLLAVSYGPRVQIWKDAFKTKQKEPYMSHLQPSTQIESLAFCPFEDVLCVGHTNGISSLAVPGAGEPNFDTLEANPYQTSKQRKETEVHSLLEKIQPEMIALNPNFVGTVDRATQEVIAEEQRLEWEANHPTEKFVPKQRARGKSSSQRRYLRKQGNVIDAKRNEVIQKLAKEKQERAEKRKREQSGEEEALKSRAALDRFNVGKRQRV
ncbi:Small subunit (SSU) processome component [Rhizophlyctis rosea]|uniref:U three protein 7 n=1 Tax=Rhizophlyctis rosea TaxID=64517 RepID=A0AAD5SH52_9FUNG|nr:Small subunit (SSU) processome component [Rhizophlyctis rosea]